MSRKKHRSKAGRSHHDEAEAVDEQERAPAGSSNGSAADPAPGDVSGVEAAEEAPGEGSESSEKVRTLEVQAEEMRELALRKQAEFENYRKRVERERSETIRYAASELVKEILPVLDNLERALGASGTSGEDQLREGVSIIYKQFKDILERRGLAEVESEGESFDPHVHEAVSRVESRDHPEGTVVEVFQKGYRFKDRLLRPAMVSVALPPSASGGDEEGAAESSDEESTS